MNRPVLLVEDNDDDIELTQLCFKNNHISNEMVIARDGAEAVNYLRAVPDLPMLVLLDLKLPKIGGLEVLRILRADERTKRLPVVVLTSSIEEKDLVNSYNLGANSYIRKPVDLDQFQEAVRQLGLYWLLLNQQPVAPPGA